MASCLLTLLVTVIATLTLVSEATLVRHKRSDDVSALQTVVDGHSQQLTQIIARLTALENRMSSQENTVAFHALHTGDPFNVASHGTIIYDTVTTNVGNAYSPRNGFFTAPVAGTYTFFVNCMAVKGTEEEAYITVEGQTVAACYSYFPSSETTYEQGFTSTTVHLSRGQQVWVKILQNAENVRGWFWNTFSGHLVQPDTQ